jgi:HPt (histidine-containing phosphotransfer) domain-containing protein
MMHAYRAVAARAMATAEDPPIDRTHLFQMTLGDHALQREVLALFDRQIEMLIERMREAEPSCVAALAHTLKGSARGVGAWPIARAAEGVEAAPPAELAPAVAVLAAAADETRAAIADILGTGRDPMAELGHGWG